MSNLKFAADKKTRSAIAVAVECSMFYVQCYETESIFRIVSMPVYWSGHMPLKNFGYIVTMRGMEDVLKLAVECAKQSGQIQRKYYEKEFAVHHKGEINLVTDVDFACQDRIVRLIRKNFPDDNIISEEQANRFEAYGNRWIIDPLDGTTNYAHGYPFFCTSIAYETRGTVMIGVVYSPIFKELFVCQRGKGAYLNGRRIRVSQTKELRKSLLTTGFPYDLATSKNNNVDHFVNFLFEAQAIRRDGSAALNLCYTACGRFDGFWEMKLNAWDIAAGALMVEEAGGRVSGIAGKKLNYYNGDVVASNGVIHKKMLNVLNTKRTAG